MDVLGGGALNNGVSYISKTHISIARRLKDNTINVNIKRLNTTKLENIIKKIPFIRGMLLPIIQAIVTYPIAIVIIVSFILILNYLFPFKNVQSSSLKYTDILIVLLFCYPKLLPIGRYHGAEHKVFNAFKNRKELTVENIKQESRISDRCGSSFVIFVFIIYFIMLLFSKLLFLNLLIGLSIGNEIFEVKNSFLRKLIKPFLFIGCLYQKYITTKEPSDKEIEIAIKAFVALRDLKRE